MWPALHGRKCAPGRPSRWGPGSPARLSERCCAITPQRASRALTRSTSTAWAARSSTSPRHRRAGWLPGQTRGPLLYVQPERHARNAGLSPTPFAICQDAHTVGRSGPGGAVHRSSTPDAGGNASCRKTPSAGFRSRPRPSPMRPRDSTGSRQCCPTTCRSAPGRTSSAATGTASGTRSTCSCSAGAACTWSSSSTTAARCAVTITGGCGTAIGPRTSR